MDITLTSSLIPEDEDRLAEAFVRVVTVFLDVTPINYSLRVETASGRVLERVHARAAGQDARADSPSPDADGEQPRQAQR